ncbi:SusC/RagA family TonB-linked outer membrane protein [Flavobacterium sp. AC]|uniref:SusC/RagA family TonB-linked outer membrane protein n=1 Tax=Flavobacterium azizsancarii TaxID=2961580 RepID=A0ABT4WAN5_9FLAO|nr:SusC/RagA family TonB-linked outer membrane protein [Flavobacterium azizsancarii]MDA6069537.1 SusC/RagA family TonB-linked outer membrane protein [Flavobacterium azizsancarii]
MNYFSFYKGGKALYCLFFIGFILSFSSSSARNSNRSFSFIFQQHQVQGVITDGNAPLPGVTISVRGRADVNSITDYTGHYSISAGINDTLAVSFIGFKTKLIPVAGRVKVDIDLQYDTTTLQEVRVNAGYYSVKESERTGSIARITSKDIENQPVTNVLATMQGRMAGVSITQTTGVPGGGFDIKIRGQNSLRSGANSPLYIIDGVPYASDPIGSGITNLTFPTLSSPLNSINPNFIESIEVLKDADATSIYGSRGSNGVVLITTKKGKVGKTKFTLTSSTGGGTVTKFMDLMSTSQYLAMRKQAFKNDGLTEYSPWDYDVNGTWDQNRYTDWQKELLGRTAQITDLQGTLSGGSENTQFMLSGSYHSQSTVFPGTFMYKKGGSQFNLNHASDNRKFRLNFSAGVTLQNNDQPSFDFSYDARSLAPNAPRLYNPDGSLNWENSTWTNPLGNLNTEFESKTNDLTAGTAVSYEIIPELIVKANLGYTNLNNSETRIVPSTIYDPAYEVSSERSAIFLNDVKRDSWIAEPQINWKKELGTSTIDILAGATFQSQRSTRLQQSGTGFTSNSLIYDLAAAKVTKVLLSDETLYKYQAFFARVNYKYKQCYILNLTARRDGSSRFGPGKQFANFGAAGLAWLFSNESFFMQNKWLSFGKIRTSYGTTGNDQIGDYQFLDTYSNTGILYNGIPGLAPSRLFNADFGWETNKKLEAALELGFFGDRIFTTVAWYQNRSSNQLAGVPLPGSTGFTSYQANLDAVVQNSGLEFTLRTVNFKGHGFTWTTNLNLTFAENKLLKFPGLESSAYNQQYRIGEPLNIKLLYSFKGVDPQTGLYTFEDLNGDGAVTFPEDRQVAVNLNPQYYGGLQNQFSYKGITLDFLFQFIKQKNRTYPMGTAGMMANQQQRKTDSWSAPGDNAAYQMFSTGYDFPAVMATYSYNESTASVTDASFIRLKNISISYDLPLDLKQTQCRVILQGQNLLTFTKYVDGDPEFTSYGFLPPLKILTAGIQLTF